MILSGQDDVYLLYTRGQESARFLCKSGIGFMFFLETKKSYINSNKILLTLFGLRVSVD